MGSLTDVTAQLTLTRAFSDIEAPLRQRSIFVLSGSISIRSHEVRFELLDKLFICFSYLEKTAFHIVDVSVASEFFYLSGN